MTMYLFWNQTYCLTYEGDSNLIKYIVIIFFFYQMHHALVCTWIWQIYSYKVDIKSSECHTTIDKDQRRVTLYLPMVAVIL